MSRVSFLTPESQKIRNQRASRQTKTAVISAPCIQNTVQTSLLIMTVPLVESVTAPADMTPEVLSDILSRKVSSYELKPLGKGVMSDVQILTVDINDSQCEMKAQYLVKFKKPEIPLPDLFSVEGEFYRLAESVLVEQPAFPFRLAKALAAGSSWLMLEYTPHSAVRTFHVHESCPLDLFDDLVKRLAKMHAFFWIHNGSSLQNNFTGTLKAGSIQLSSNPGTGHSLPVDSRQEQFLPAWPAVRERLAAYIKNDSLLRVDAIVQWTSTNSRIKKCTNLVSEQRRTVIHGDYHIGNILVPNKYLQRDECDSPLIPWLVDWSMAGIGNPLVDLVFFLVVGAKCIPVTESGSTEVSRAVNHVLEQYHNALKGCENKTSVTNEMLLSWEDLVSMFRMCVLNQFILLICFDSLCRDVANGYQSKNEKHLYHAHFDRVNIRCVMMLLSNLGWIEDMV